MISGVYLENFKCFDRLELPLASFNLLAGLNGMGKSTVIQALLALRQSNRIRPPMLRLLLSGDLVELGTGQDVLFDGASTDEIAIGFEHSYPDLPLELRTVYRFRYTEAAESLRLKRNQQTRSKSTFPLPEYFVRRSEDWEQTDRDDLPLPARRTFSPLFSFQNFQYLSAERIGPRKYQPLSEDRVRSRDLGTAGEYVLQYLLAYGDDVVGDRSEDEFFGKDDLRLSEHASARSLKEQTVGWLRDVSPGTRLDIEEIRSIDAAFARFSFERSGDVATRPLRPTNVGFGLSFVLPVVVAFLSAKPNDLVVVENPEAHLHPKGQTRLGQLAARTAAAGVQVIIETHSDHFMDGCRIEVRNGMIEPQQTRFHFFERHAGRSTFFSPEIDQDGRLSEWPEGFFDQHDLNLTQLLKPLDS